MVAIVGTVFPGDRQWVGVGRELIAGTAVQPVITVPADKPEPDDKPTWLMDKGLRGFMGENYGEIQGTEVADFSLNGNVYLDSIGYFLQNLMGDYSATGSTPTNATTFTAPLAVGATTGTLTSPTGYTATSVVQIGSGPTAEVVQFTALAGSNATWANNPIRFAHSGTPAAVTVVAPFTHTFNLLNSGNAQPCTHTLTHYQGISASTGARQYACWCASEMAFTMNAEQLFTHSTKGSSFLGAIAGSAPTNVIDAIPALAAWRLLVGIGGPASGGTLISDVAEAGITIARNIKPRWTGSGQQTPYVIARNALSISGKFTEVAQNENPLLNMLNNVQPQLQLVITNGLAGASLLSCTFNLQVGAYTATKLNAGNEEIEYDVTFEGVMNTTNIGGSGGMGPGSVVIVNAVPTY